MKPKTLQCFSLKNYSHLLGFGTHYLTLFEYKLVLYSIHPSRFPYKTATIHAYKWILPDLHRAFFIIYSITINLFIIQINIFVLLNYTSYYELYLLFKLYNRNPKQYFVKEMDRRRFKKKE